MPTATILRALVEESDRLKSLWLQIKATDPAAAEHVYAAGEDIARAIGTVATARVGSKSGEATS
jgi:hypothetical protein